MKRFSFREQMKNSDNLTQAVAVGIAVGIVVGIIIDVYFTPIIEVAHAEVIEEVVQPKEVLLEVAYNWDIVRTKEEIRKAADKYGVSYEKMNATVKCESNYDLDVQSHHILSYGRELSFGLAQFHLPSKNRDAQGVVITKEMALDPLQALDAMAYHFSIGNARLWTCYRMLYR